MGRKYASTIAAQRIRDYICNQNLSSGTALPSLIDLAAFLDVSLTTVSNAMAALKQEGVVSGVAGHRFTVGQPVISSPTLGSNIPAQDNIPHTNNRNSAPRVWERTRMALRKDVLDHTFPPGSMLPSLKELGNRYQVCVRTLGKALHALTEEGVLAHKGVGFEIPAFTSRIHRSRLVWIAFSFDSFTMHLSQHDEELFRCVERQCAAGGVELDVYLICAVSVDDQGSAHHKLRDRRTGRLMEVHDFTMQDASTTLGYILIVIAQPKDIEIELVRALKPQLRPIAVLDESASWEFPVDIASARHVRRFTITGSPRHGLSVAEHIYNLGHRSVAFISPYNEYTWSQRRLDGARAVYGKKGPPCSVSDFIQGSNRPIEMCIDKLLNYYRRWRTMVSSIAALEFDGAMDALQKRTTELAQVRAIVYPLFENALACKEITAWITVNDTVAFMALEFLAKRGVPVPDRISLISFDDATDALRLNLTSYNFNASGVATLMLGFIFNREPYASFAKSEGIHELDGYIIERRTTGPGPAKRE